MTVLNATHPLADLQRMLSASRQNYDACIDHVVHTHTCSGVTATMRMHHLKFDANGQPKVSDLASCLVNHAIDYAISARHRPATMTAQEAAKYMQEARKLFRVVTVPAEDAELAGEAGELLLYFLLETVLEAPQVVAKVELKTSPALEVNGSDGIHMRWNPTDSIVDVYFGESKLYKSVGAALTNAFNSIESFHANGMRVHEYAMATKFFKGVDDHVKDAVTEVLYTGRPGPGARINHACLIGYDWTANGLTPGQAAAEVEAQYRQQYLADAKRLHRLLQTRFDKCQRKHFGFEVFFLPFTSVQGFRDAFIAAME
ncbi:MAG: DUF1837 domain-containing protein [Phycisphaeraceae bacterium]|nr:MAG: DUF1837 domain-containing protein [Phycisphaeraceae bacterium]